MNLHITPSFNIDRLCKTASVLLFLVQNASNYDKIIVLLSFLIEQVYVKHCKGFVSKFNERDIV